MSIETGLRANIGQRLLAAQKYLVDEDLCLANNSDGLTDLDLTNYLAYAREQDKIATFLSMRPNLSYHMVQTGTDGLVTGINEFATSGIRVNAGIFVLKKDIFTYMMEGEELVMQPFRRLIQARQLAAYGFFAAMDTFKDKQQLDDLYEGGQAPWEVWRDNRGSGNESRRGKEPFRAVGDGYWNAFRDLIVLRKERRGRTANSRAFPWSSVPYCLRTRDRSKKIRIRLGAWSGC
jgi:NDP-sugar pyrophosphorylase family protein